MYYKMDLETYDGIECKLNLTLCFKSIWLLRLVG